MADQIESDEIVNAIAERLLTSAADLPEGFIIECEIRNILCFPGIYCQQDSEISPNMSRIVFGR